MGYVVLNNINRNHSKRKGLEGPFHYVNGRVLYYDPREGKYWDPTTDFYVEYEEVQELQNDLVRLLRA